MFLGMQDFDFAQISPQFFPNHALILPKFRPNPTKFVQISPILSKKILLEDAASSSFYKPSSFGTNYAIAFL